MQLILHCLRIQFNYEKCWIVRCHGNDGITMVHSQDQLPQSNDLDVSFFLIFYNNNNFICHIPSLIIIKVLKHI